MNLPYRFGRYLLTSKVAQGGMAEIYRARYFGEGGFVKEVAVKKILPNLSLSKDFVTMLCDEAKALVKLQHKNIVQVYELGKDKDSYYISMEYVDGVDLRRLFKKVVSESGLFPLKFSCFVISEILQAMDFAHNRDIIHRDVSPPNILISYNGEVKVADFGIAKGGHRQFETVVTEVKGKYSYMSPEQAEGKTVDVRSDLYAIGVIFFELITGKRLFNAPNDFLAIEQVKKSELPEGWKISMPNELSQIIARALQKESADRYRSAADFLDELKQYIVGNGLVTDSIELSQYAKDLFRAEYEKAFSEARQKNNTQIDCLKKSGKKDAEKKNIRTIYLASFTIVSAILFSSGSNLTSGKINVSPESFGTISVQARPWGYVYISGLVDKKETPLKEIKLKSGKYIVKVNYEPEGIWLQKEITIAESKHVRCFADFLEQHVLSCQYFR
jgi:serine/threonine protein kinase